MAMHNRKLNSAVGVVAQTLWLSFLVQIIALAGCSRATDPGVDRIFINAHAYTFNEAMPWAEAIAVDGDSIVYVGENEAALALAGDKTVQHDLQGQMLLPGFIDTHMHPISGGAYAKALSLDTFGSVDEGVATLDRGAPDYLPPESGDSAWRRRQAQLLHAVRDK